jgi:hypothetical protein
MSQPDVDQELERLLNATRSGTEPAADTRARIRAALATGLGGAGAAKAGVVTRAGLGAKLWLLAALGVALVLGASLVGSPERSRQASTVAAVSASTVALATEPPASPPEAAPLVVATPSSSAAAVGVAGHAQPAPPRSAAKAAEPADELALVSSMQLALRSGNAPQALLLANEHARRFPGGALAQEREGARAIAHCQLASTDARPAILANFEQHYAGSPYAARVKDACTR